MGIAPGAPGVAQTWTGGAKDAVTSGIGASRVWATLGRGVLNEIYWPTTGIPQVRQVTFIVRCGDRWIDVAGGEYTVTYPRPELPLPTIEHRGDGFRLMLAVAADPIRDALLVRYDLDGGDEVAFQLQPSLGGSALGDTAWIEHGAALATGDGKALAVMAVGGFVHAAAGYAGTSDTLTELAAGLSPSWAYDRAESGNVAVSGLLVGRSGALAIGFADSTEGARALARSLLAEGADAVAQRARASWDLWASAVHLPGGPGQDSLERVARCSLAVLKVHEDATFPGALVASLSMPWGTTRADAGGYHLVWPRDLVQSGLALLAAGLVEDARRVLAYLIAMQADDGHWPQNFFPNGGGYWTGVQLDETALPVILAAALRDRHADRLAGTTDMVRRAVGFLTARGPMSPQDRWEENPGANAFTLATIVAALTAAAPWLEGEQAADAQDVADEWNERLESWTFVVGTPLAESHGVEGYYVRLSPPVDDGGLSGYVEVRNRAGVTISASALVSIDYLALARYGLRHPLDARLVNTTQIVDDLLGVSTPSGVVYHRYNEDGYGEHDDGTAFDGTGIGRLWPLLTGERGHYALQCGEDPTPFLQTMANCTGPGGLLPEQVWNGPPIPDRALFPGRPTGSAMPLAWAHAEFLKLYLASGSGVPIEALPAVTARYGSSMPAAKAWRWRTNTPVHQLPAGRDLIVEAGRPFTLHFGWDGWLSVTDSGTVEQLPGRWQVRLPAALLAGHDTLQFTRLFTTGWEGVDHDVVLQHEHGDRHLRVHRPSRR